jgi:hypothetical protein
MCVINADSVSLMGLSIIISTVDII